MPSSCPGVECCLLLNVHHLCPPPGIRGAGDAWDGRVHSPEITGWFDTSLRCQNRKQRPQSSAGGSNMNYIPAGLEMGTWMAQKWLLFSLTSCLGDVPHQHLGSCTSSQPPNVLPKVAMQRPERDTGQPVRQVSSQKSRFSQLDSTPPCRRSVCCSCWIKLAPLLWAEESRIMNQQYKRFPRHRLPQPLGDDTDSSVKITGSSTAKGVCWVHAVTWTPTFKLCLHKLRKIATSHDIYTQISLKMPLNTQYYCVPRLVQLKHLPVTLLSHLWALCITSASENNILFWIFSAVSLGNWAWAYCQILILIKLMEILPVTSNGPHMVLEANS